MQRSGEASPTLLRDPLLAPTLLLTSTDLCQKINTSPKMGQFFISSLIPPKGAKSADGSSRGKGPTWRCEADCCLCLSQEEQQPRGTPGPVARSYWVIPEGLSRHEASPCYLAQFSGQLWVSFSLRLSLLCQFLFKSPLSYKAAIFCPRSQST